MYIVKPCFIEQNEQEKLGLAEFASNWFSFTLLYFHVSTNTHTSTPCLPV